LARNSNRRQLALVLIAAGLVRTAFMLWSISGWYFFMPQNTLSERFFLRGYAIAAGYGYVVENSPRGDAVLNELYRRVNADNIRALPKSAEPLSKDDMRLETMYPPGMSLMIAAIHRILGTKADVPLQLIGVVLDTASAGIFWWTVTTFVGPKVGLMAGLLYALFPPFAYAAVSKMPDGMLSFFLVAFLACVLKATIKHGWREVLWNIAAGVCIGLGGYLRPDYIFVPVFIFFGLWAYTRGFWRSAAAIGIIQTTALLVLLPWANRNYTICDRWIYTGTSVGAVLVTGLGQFQNPWGFGGSDADRDKQAMAQGISTPWGCEGDRYFRALFLESVRERPGAYMMTIIRRLPLALATPYAFGFQNPWKTSRFLAARESGEDYYQVVMRRPWYVLTAYWDHLAISVFTFVCLLATLLMILKERSKTSLILLIISPHLYSIGSHMITNLEPRYILPSMFSWLVGLAYVLSGGWSDRELMRSSAKELTKLPDLLHQ
jgi:4-amino-4-deoxy-L-arabinose transferase-like glycosyltransferase